jgi:hypothetical protein
MVQRRLAATKPMIEIPKKARSRNSAEIARLRMGGNWIRLEPDHHTELELIALCLRGEGPPDHIKQVKTGVFTVDLPADVFKTVWFTDGGFWIGVYGSRLSRSEDLL